MIFNPNTDATLLYRETSALKTIRMDQTGDTGSLMEIMRDATVTLGAPTAHQSSDLRIPSARGDIDAYCRG